MTWLKDILNMVIIFSLICPAASFARSFEQLSEVEKAQFSQYQKYLEPMGYELHMDKNREQANVIDKTTQKLVMEIPFSSEESIRRYTPKKMNKMLLDEMIKVKQAGKAAWSHSLKNLPMESAVFFMAMGAVVAGQVINNYAQNPVAMDQHIKHQLSPLGVASFFTFMYAQGVTSNVLALYMTNPKFHHMIPYLGMSVGFFASAYLSSIVSDPNVKACAKTMMGYQLSASDKKAGIADDPCEKAYEHLAVKKKVWELAPSLVSMLSSAALAGVGQAILTKTVLRITGVDIAMWLVPGTMQLKGLRLLLVKGLQISAFVALDVWLHSRVTYAWKNIFDGRDLAAINNNLVADISAAKSSHWGMGGSTLVENLKNFRTKASDWRMMNMSSVYEAHHNWTENLQQLTGMYNASYGFYQSMIKEIRISQSGKKSRLDQSSLLNGVLAADLAEGKEDLYFSHPHFVEPMQMETVNQAAEKLALALQDAKTLRLLFPHEKKAILDIQTKLASPELETMGQGLLDIKDLQVKMNMSPTGYSFGLRTLLKDLSGNLGKPNPYRQHGRSYVDNYSNFSGHKEQLESIKFPTYSGIFKTDKIGDYFVGQMICGPDAEKGERLIRQTRGFPALFVPPALRHTDDELDQYCGGSQVYYSTDHLYSLPMKSYNSAEKYKGALEYLKSQTRKSALGSDENGFAQWWKRNSEKQMQEAFDYYGQEYQSIVANLMSALNRTDSSAINSGPLSNGILVALFQEARVYNLILGELLKDIYKKQHGKSLPVELFDPSQEPAVKYTSAESKSRDTVPFIKMLSRNTVPTLEWSRLIQPFTLNKTIHSNSVQPLGYRLKIQSAVETELARINGLLQQIKVEKNGKQLVVKSPIENYELENAHQNLQAVLTQYSNLLGVGDAGETGLVTLNKEQADLAVLCLEGLQGLGSELMMFGTIANAVDWNKIQGLKKQNIEQQKFNNKVQELLGQLRGFGSPGLK